MRKVPELKFFLDDSVDYAQNIESLLKISLNVPFYIANATFFEKITQCVHLISYISMLGVAVGTAALIIVLSVFNGFENLVLSLYNSFDPAIKITAVEGKVFQANECHQS